MPNGIIESEAMMCMTCNGEGFIVTCFDDICNGLGYCIHGDGEETCPECGGEGEVREEDEWEQGDDDLDQQRWIEGDQSMNNKPNFHEIAKAVVEEIWNLSPLIVALIAFNFRMMIKKELDEGTK